MCLLSVWICIDGYIYVCVCLCVQAALSLWKLYRDTDFHVYEYFWEMFLRLFFWFCTLRRTSLCVCVCVCVCPCVCVCVYVRPFAWVSVCVKCETSALQRGRSGATCWASCWVTKWIPYHLKSELPHATLHINTRTHTHAHTLSTAFLSINIFNHLLQAKHAHALTP